MSTLHKNPHPKLACDLQLELFQNQTIINRIRFEYLLDNCQNKVVFTFNPRCIKEIRWWILQSKCKYTRWSHSLLFYNQI